MGPPGPAVGARKKRRTSRLDELRESVSLRGPVVGLRKKKGTQRLDGQRTAWSGGPAVGWRRTQGNTFV